MLKKSKFSLILLIGLFLIFAIAGAIYAVSYMWVSLNPNTPPGGFISPTSTNVAFLKFDIQNTASSTEDIILKTLAITNSGTSSNTSSIFSHLYLYDEVQQIATSTKRIGENMFVFKEINYTIPSSTASTFTIKADLGESATSGQTIILGINSATHIKAEGESTASSTVIMGNFPITGNTFTIW